MTRLERAIRPAPSAEPTIVHLVTDVDALERTAAREFSRRAREAVEARGVFTVALGSDPTLHGVYRRLARRSTWRELPETLLVDDAPWDSIDPLLAGRDSAQRLPVRDQVPWGAVHLFQTDEFHVPPSHADSRFGALGRNLLAHLPLRPENVHRIRGEERSAAQAARDYERHILRFFANGPGGGVPRFDLVLLGLGPDGETAALHAGVGLNGDGSAAGGRALVAAPWVPRFGSHRITMTPELLSSARAVMFVAAGVERAGAVRDVLEGRGRPGSCPARLVRPAAGEVRWIVDRAAAGRLEIRA